MQTDQVFLRLPVADVRAQFEAGSKEIVYEAKNHTLRAPLGEVLRWRQGDNFRPPTDIFDVYTRPEAKLVLTTHRWMADWRLSPRLTTPSPRVLVLQTVGDHPRVDPSGPVTTVTVGADHVYHNIPEDGFTAIFEDVPAYAALIVEGTPHTRILDGDVLVLQRALRERLPVYMPFEERFLRVHDLLFYGTLDAQPLVSELPPEKRDLSLRALLGHAT